MSTSFNVVGLLDRSSQDILAFLLDAAIKGTVVLVVAWLATLMMRRSSAAARHGVWAVALLSLLLLPVLAAVLPGWGILPPSSMPMPSRAATALLQEPVAAEDVAAGTSAASSQADSALPQASSAARQDVQPISGPPPVPRHSANITWEQSLVLLWLGGVVVTMVPAVLGAWSLRRLQRRATRVDDDPLLPVLSDRIGLHRRPILLRSAEREMPMTWGILRPRLLLPDDYRSWAEDRRCAVMLHELAHVARRDCLWQWIAHLARAAYWFHPLAWLAVRRMSCEQERACDDRVLAAGGARAADYADHLLHVAASLQPPPRLTTCAAIAMARRSNLETRIVAILDPRTDRRRLTRVAIALVGLLALLVPPLAMMRAAAQAPPSTTKAQVRTVDDNEKPVAGVDVYLFHERFADRTDNRSGIVRLGPLKSDAVGAVTFDIPSPITEPKWTRTSLLARIPGKQIGIQITDDPAKPVTVTMVPAGPLKGIVKVPAGFDSRRVKVATYSMIVPHGTARMSMIQPGVDAWPELFEFPVAADGTFTVPEAPVMGGVYITGTAKGLGEAQFRAGAGASLAEATLDLRAEGVIEGVLTRDGDNAPGAGVVIRAHPDHRSGLVVTHSYDATTDAAGRFRIGGLPESVFTLSAARFDPDAVPEWVMPNREGVLVRPGATAGGIQLRLERGALVAGKVIEAGSGKGVPGVHVTALNPADHGASGVANSTTDAEGKYTVRLPTGGSMLYLSGVPDGYAYPPQPESEKTISVAKGERNREVPAFVISRPSDPREPAGISVLRGRVVDEKGKGVAGVHIADYRVELWPGREMPVQDPKAAVTDREGRFEFKATAGITHRLSVSAVQWQHDETKEFTPQKDEAFTHPDIVVRERPIAGTITGVVVDVHGKPIEGVAVGHRSSVRTDANGTFSMEVRGEPKPTTIVLRKTGYAMRNWNDVPPDGKDLRFVLPATDRPAPIASNARPPKPTVDKPAPALDVSTWVHLPAGKPLPGPFGTSGRKTLVLFAWNCADAEPVRQALRSLDAEAAKANADAILIVGPQSHESGVRAMLGDDKPNVAIGIDRFDVDGTYDIKGATMAAWGFGPMPHAFVVDERGMIRHAQRGVDGLAAVAGK